MVATGSLSLIMLLASLAGNAPDIVSLIPTADYFASRDIETSVEKMMEVASREPADGKAQLQQLLALRVLGSDPAKFKASAGAVTYHQTLEQIAKGTKAQGQLGFAKEYALRALARIDGTKAPALVSPPLREGFSWFPPDSDIVVGVDFRQMVGSLARVDLDVNDIVKLVPAEIREEIYKTVEKLGNIEIDRFSFAELPTGDRSYLYFRVEGKFNPEWILTVTNSYDLTDKAEHRKGSKDEEILIPHVKFAQDTPAIAFIGQTALGIAYDEHAPAKSGELLDEMLAIRGGKGQSVVDGRLKAELQKIPEKALAVLVGEMPQAFKAELTRDFGVAPLKIVSDIQRGDKGFKVSVDAAMASAEDAKTGADYIAKQREQAIAEFDGTRGLPPGLPAAEIAAFFKSIQSEAKDTSLHVSLFIADDLLGSAPRVFGLIGVRQQVAPPAAALPIGR